MSIVQTLCLDKNIRRRFSPAANIAVKMCGVIKTRESFIAFEIVIFLL
jgi:hypothetical protein